MEESPGQLWYTALYRRLWFFEIAFAMPFNDMGRYFYGLYYVKSQDTLFFIHYDLNSSNEKIKHKNNWNEIY